MSSTCRRVHNLIHYMDLAPHSWQGFLHEFGFVAAMLTQFCFILVSRRMFGTTGTCSNCAQQIPADEMVMRSQTAVYHLKCFTCVQCNAPLNPGDKYSFVNGSLFCEHEFPKLFGTSGSTQQDTPNSATLPTTTTPPTNNRSRQKVNWISVWNCLCCCDRVWNFAF